MKKLISIYLIPILFFALFFSACSSQKTKIENQLKTTELIKNNHFKFVAQQENPLRPNIIGAQLRNLDCRYDLKIGQDTIKCYLPFFGQARQVDYGSTNNGI